MPSHRLLAVVAVALFALPLSAADDPEFAGKKLSAWAADLDSKDDGTFITALHAVRGLGPKGLPALPAVLKWRPADDSRTRLWAVLGAVEAMGPGAVPGLFDALADKDLGSRAWLVLFHQRPAHEVMEAEFVRAWDAAKDAPSYRLVLAGELFTRPSTKVSDRLATQLAAKEAFTSFSAARGLATVGPTHKEAEKAVRALLNPEFFREQPDNRLLGAHIRAANKFGAAAIPVYAEQLVQPGGKQLNWTVLVYLQPADDPATAKLAALLRPFIQKPPPRKDGGLEPGLPWNNEMWLVMERLEAMGPHAKEAVPELTDIVIAAAADKGYRGEDANKATRRMGESATRILLNCGVKREDLPKAFRDVPPSKEEQVKALKALAEKTKKGWGEKDGNRSQTISDLMKLVPDDPDLPRLWAESQWRMHTGGYVRVSDGGYTDEALHPRSPKFALPKVMHDGLRKQLTNDKLDANQRLAVAQELVWHDPNDPAAEVLADEFARLTKAKGTDESGPEADNLRGIVAAYQTAAGLPQLVAWLDHDDRRVRAFALTAIVHLGPVVAKPALPDVKKRLTAEVLADRFRFAAAVSALDPTDPGPLAVVKEVFDPKNRQAATQLRPQFRLLFLNRDVSIDPVFPRLGPVHVSNGLQEAADIYFRLAPEEAVKADVFTVAYPKPASLGDPFRK